MSGKIPLGITINVYQPIIDLYVSYTPKGQYLYSLSNIVESYSHTIQAFGGYESATFTLKASSADIDDWLERGLNRHIEVFDPQGIEIWEGYVDQLNYSVGGFQVQFGPLSSIANRVWVEFTKLDDSTRPPSAGAKYESLVEDEFYSQNSYGIFERVLSGGTITIADADQLRDTYLAESSYVETTKQWNSTGTNEPVLEVICKGYFSRLSRIYYLNDSDETSYTCTEAITDLLDYDSGTGLMVWGGINFLFSAANADIGVNAVDTQRWCSEYTTPDQLIKDVVNKGGVAYNRWLFYVGNNRRATYRAIDTDIAYYQQLRDPAQRVRNRNGMDILPHNVWPGKWLMFTDFFSGRSMPSTPTRADPRLMFIESVTFTAPDVLDLSGSKVARVPQILAEYGLGGI
jgi:hypothetical protein